jgi:formate hydrogenlyase transcriptional activator
MPIDANKRDLRKTGIAVVGDMPWGAHFCHFYETKEDLLATVVPYFKTGLENNEFCLWVISDSETDVEAAALTREEATGALLLAVPDLERHLAARSIEIVPNHEWYLGGSVFDSQQVVNGWKKKLDEALFRGYAGIRVTGNVGWLPERDWKNFLEYERGLNEAIANDRMIALCTYPLAVRPAAEVFNVGQAHEFAIARRHGNWEVFETPGTKQTKAELTTLKEELEHRIRDHTSQLATTNEQLKTEIAQRKQTEDALRRSEEQLRVIIDSIPVLMATTLADGSADYVNRRWLDYYGVTLEDLTDWRWRKAGVVHPEDEPKLVAEWREALSSGTAYETEFRMRRFDGEYRWFLTRTVPKRDEYGNIVKWYSAGFDIEDRKRAEEELRASERQFRHLVDLIPAAVYACAPSGRITYYNRRAAELWGREPIPGDTAERYCGSLRLYDQDGRLVDHDQSLMAEALRTGEAYYNREVLIERPDKSRLTVLVNVAAIRNEKDEVVGAINCFQDVTDRKSTEAALERAFQEIQALKDQLQKENLVLKEEIHRSSMFEEIVGRSPALHAVLGRVGKVAPTDSTVLITGETGTGKELIARAIHKRSHRSSRPFVSVNCAAIPASLIASELFGHEKGAFTGAVQRRLGRFELAEGGTIFLDEVGDLPAEMQIALLRVVQEREFERVGGHQSIRSNVRILAATHRDLSAAIVTGAFRSDLFYRLNVFPIEIPPLRERREDIQLLVEYFINRYGRKAGKKIRSINKKALELLKSYAWPGNIRELQNVIERSVIVSESEELFVDEWWLSPVTPGTQAVRDTLSKKPPAQMKKIIEAALVETRGRVSGPSGAAAKLGIPPSTLESKIKALKINKRRFKIIYPSRTR